MDLAQLLYTAIEQRLSQQIDQAYADHEPYSKIEALTKLYTIVTGLSSASASQNYVQEAHHDDREEVIYYYLKKIASLPEYNLALPSNRGHQEAVEVATRYLLSEITHDFTSEPNVLYLQSAKYRKNFEGVLDQLWSSSHNHSTSSTSTSNRNLNPNDDNLKIAKVITFAYELAVLLYFEVDQLSRQKIALGTTVEYAGNFLYYKNVSAIIEFEAENYRKADSSFEHLEVSASSSVSTRRADVVSLNIELASEAMSPARPLHISLASIATETETETTSSTKAAPPSYHSNEYPQYSTTVLQTAQSPRRVLSSTVRSVSEASESQATHRKDEVFSFTDSNSTPVYIYTPPNIEDVISMHDHSEISSINQNEAVLNFEPLPLHKSPTEISTLTIQNDGCSRQTLVPNLRSQVLMSNDNLLATSELFLQENSSAFGHGLPQAESFSGLNFKIDDTVRQVFGQESSSLAGIVRQAAQETRQRRNSKGKNDPNARVALAQKSIKDIINEATTQKLELQKRLSECSSLNGDFENFSLKEGKENISRILTIAGIAAVSLGFVILNKTN